MDTAVKLLYVYGFRASWWPVLTLREQVANQIEAREREKLWEEGLR